MNPAEPPILMRNTVYAEIPGITLEVAQAAVSNAVEEVAAYVPGYRLKAPPMVEGEIVTVLLEVEGAADYLPRYAGNLDIMTAAALRTAEMLAEERGWTCEAGESFSTT
jgi:acetaldehyde dehydrogenase (acetylating)